ncbi:polymer-forming cytoskeletal protein [candidate division KSB1 bacterium]|nr:polymer-forming cytoskeletal protein [candidate division KSB1 bacterium]MBL7095656.1 polymer-forming cytoskeletal protein [candidate division KSB1 bacterium]
MLGKKDETVISGSGDLNTLIGKGTVLEGKITVSSNVRVDGKIKGDLTTNESLVIGKQGEIEGEVTAKNTVVGGKVTGKINARGKVVLESNAIFKGEITAARLIIDDGAVFDGQCTMNDSGNLKPEIKKDKHPAKSG